MFGYCAALTTLTLPKSVSTVSRSAFADTSFDQVFFEGKTLAQVKAMANYSRWGLTEDKIYTNAFENQLPTKTSDLTNDSGFITANDIITKRDLSDMTVKGVPQNTNSQSWFNIKYGTTTEDAWYYEEGRWETGMTLKVLATSTWQVFELQKLVESQYSSLGTFSLDGNFEATITHEGVTYSITGYIGNLVTSDQLISQIATLEARISALENN